MMRGMKKTMNRVCAKIGPHSLVELAGDRRILIENHQGVTQYTTEQVCVAVSYGMVLICGTGLSLRYMSKDRLIISGQIQQMEIKRRCS